jgi:predicted ATPase
MKISSFKVKNYKSFRNSGWFNFSSGFNVIVGQNNVGKSAILEALGLKFSSKPHRSVLSVPSWGTRLDPASSAELTFTLRASELRRILEIDLRDFYLPMPKEPEYQNDQASLNQLVDTLFNRSEIDFKVGLNASESKEGEFVITEFPTFGNLYRMESATSSTSSRFIQIRVTEKGWRQVGHTNADKNTEAGLRVAAVIRSRIFNFRAERIIPGISQTGHSAILESTAGNLAEVLSVLQGNLALFDNFNALVRQVFPSIYAVSVSPRPDNKVEVVVWTEDPRNYRTDLTISLSESGTGVGQVLAILYVALTSAFPSTILIDEPNSFLHPSAARKLIEILRRDFSQHQYIVTTHSPEIIRTAQVNTLTLIRWEKPQSIVEQLDVNQLEEMQKCLLEVGANETV